MWKKKQLGYKQKYWIKSDLWSLDLVYIFAGATGAINGLPFSYFAFEYV